MPLTSGLSLLLPLSPVGSWFLSGTSSLSLDDGDISTISSPFRAAILGLVAGFPCFGGTFWDAGVGHGLAQLFVQCTSLLHQKQLTRHCLRLVSFLPVFGGSLLSGALPGHGSLSDDGKVDLHLASQDVLYHSHKVLGGPQDRQVTRLS